MHLITYHQNYATHTLTLICSCLWHAHVLSELVTKYLISNYY